MSNEPISAPLATYQSGKWMAITGPTAWLLLDSGVGDPLVAAAWDALREPDGVAAVQRVLRDPTGGGSRSFGLVAQSGTSVVVLLSGAALAEVETTGSSDQLRCPPGAAVAEYRLANNLASLTIYGGEPADDAWFPIGSAVARASTLVLEWTAETGNEWDVPANDDYAILRPTTPSALIQSEGAGPSVTVEPPVRTSQARPSPPPEAGTGDDDIDQLGAATIRDTTVGGATIPASLNPDLLISDGPPAGDVSTQTEPDGGGTYDHLFGRTEARSVEDAAVRVPTADGPTEAASPARAPSPAPPKPEPVHLSPPPLPPLPPKEVKRAATTGLIDEVPWLSPDNNGEGAAATPVLAETPGDDAGHVELTVSRAIQKTLLNQITPGGLPDPSRPPVHAVRCPSQHPNPAHADSCRICGAPISDQAVVTVPRPVLGRLRLSTGDEVTLDRGVLMGRKPAEDRQTHGERPHLVQLQSPDHGISRNHVEVRLDGWHVLVLDLQSTNGTLISRPGQPPERLRPNQPTMIEPGTVVTLADDITFTYEATA